jgi:hypothetical protein
VGFAKLARTWIGLAEDLERTQAFLNEVIEETTRSERPKAASVSTLP